MNNPACLYWQSLGIHMGKISNPKSEIKQCTQFSLLSVHHFRPMWWERTVISARKTHFSWMLTIRMAACVVFVWGSPNSVPAPLGTKLR